AAGAAPEEGRPGAAAEGPRRQGPARTGRHARRRLQTLDEALDGGPHHSFHHSSACTEALPGRTSSAPHENTMNMVWLRILAVPEKRAPSAIGLPVAAS